MQNATQFETPDTQDEFGCWGFLIQDTTVNHASRGSEYIDRNGSEYSADTVQDSTPFATEVEARHYLDTYHNGEAAWAVIVPTPQGPSDDVNLYI